MSLVPVVQYADQLQVGQLLRSALDEYGDDLRLLVLPDADGNCRVQKVTLDNEDDTTGEVLDISVQDLRFTLSLSEATETALECIRQSIEPVHMDPWSRAYYQVIVNQGTEEDAIAAALAKGAFDDRQTA